MSYTIKLGQFKKRVNSTKQPDTTNWASYDVTLKQAPVDYDRPTFLLEAEFATIAPLNYNYATAFGRFYWIEDLKAVRTNLIEITLAFDVLASNRTSIMATKAFIEYGANTFDAGAAATRIADSRRPVSKNPTASTASASFSDGALSSIGTYILTAVSGNSGVTAYAISGGALRNIMSQIATDIEGDIDSAILPLDPTDTPANLACLTELLAVNYKNSIFAESAASAIKSIHWLPLNYTVISGTAGTVYLGQYSTGETGKILSNNPLWTYSSAVSIPWPVSDWKRNNIQISLYIPFFGTIPVPVDQCINNASVAFTVSCDVLSGDLSIRVTSGSQTIYTGSTNISAPYAFGISAVSASKNLSGGIQAVGGVMQMATGVIDAGAGIASAAFGLGGGGISGGVSSMIGGAQNALSGYAQMIQPVITSAGSMGGIAALGQTTNVILTLLYYPPITDTDFESIYGHPVYKVDTPVLGFCKTRGFSWESEEYAKYIAYVNAVLDGGCYIE